MNCQSPHPTAAVGAAFRWPAPAACATFGHPQQVLPLTDPRATLQAALPGYAIERIQRKIETAARLQHPHILTVHDSGDAAGLLWFIMPCVEGESLRARTCSS